MADKLTIHQGDNLEILKTLEDKTYELVYTDPPYNTKIIQKRKRSSHGKEIVELSSLAYEDNKEDFIFWLRQRVEQIYRILSDDGSFFLQLDFREVHYAKVMCDEVFGRNNFINEIIWSYDFGARAKKKWSANMIPFCGMLKITKIISSILTK